MTPASVWSAVQANPAYAPELISLAAVERLGPEVRTQLTWLRDTYPNATPYQLTRLATNRFVRQARNRGAAAGLFGTIGVLVDSAWLAWTQAQLVLHLAAAAGQDPTDPERAAELLVLQRIHPDLDSARAALEEAQAPPADIPASLTTRMAAPLSRVVALGMLRLALARRVKRWLPGGGAMITAITDAHSTARLAARAQRLYLRA